jgi:Glyoxalase/Bleomycin resistance protein/Dioxygenase superfamily
MQITPIRHEDLYHTGIVVDDIESAKDEYADLLGITWLEGEGETDMLLADGPCRITMRVAYSDNGPHRLELIQSVPGTLWTVPFGGHVHHVGYWSDDLAGATAFLSSRGLPRVANLGTTSDTEFTTGVYHQARNGIYIEVIDRAMYPYMFGDKSLFRRRP